MSDTPLTDKLKIPSEALLLLGQKGVPEKIVQAILTLGDHSRSLERHANAMAEALGKEGQVDLMAQHNALAAWRAFVKENS